MKNFWKNRNLSNRLNAGWNTYAQIHNTVSAAWNAPSALGRVAEALFGGKGKKKSDTLVVMCAIFLIILAIFGGYFTASAIMKKADREYDMFGNLQKRQQPELLLIGTSPKRDYLYLLGSLFFSM